MNHAPRLRQLRRRPVPGAAVAVVLALIAPACAALCTTNPAGVAAPTEGAAPGHRHLHGHHAGHAPGDAGAPGSGAGAVGEPLAHAPGAAGPCEGHEAALGGKDRAAPDGTGLPPPGASGRASGLVSLRAPAPPGPRDAARAQGPPVLYRSLRFRE